MSWLMIFVILVMIVVGYWVWGNLTSGSAKPAWVDNRKPEMLLPNQQYACLSVETSTIKNKVLVLLQIYDRTGEERQDLGVKSTKEAQAVRQSMKDEGWQEVYQDKLNYIERYFFIRPLG